MIGLYPATIVAPARHRRRGHEQRPRRPTPRNLGAINNAWTHVQRHDRWAPAPTGATCAAAPTRRADDSYFSSRSPAPQRATCTINTDDSDFDTVLTLYKPQRRSTRLDTTSTCAPRRRHRRPDHRQPDAPAPTWSWSRATARATRATTSSASRTPRSRASNQIDLRRRRRRDRHQLRRSQRRSTRAPITWWSRAGSAGRVGHLHACASATGLVGRASARSSATTTTVRAATSLIERQLDRRQLLVPRQGLQLRRRRALPAARHRREPAARGDPAITCDDDSGGGSAARIIAQRRCRPATTGWCSRATTTASSGNYTLNIRDMLRDRVGRDPRSATTTAATPARR